jgi:hypothetical protein
MPSDRTKHCIFFCKDASGEKSDEYVVKLKVGMETGGNALARKIEKGQMT